MSILVVTPAYGAQVTTAYMRSCMALQETFLRNNIDFEWLFNDRDSLISRARITSVTTFLDLDYDYLLFIDGDIEFTPDDVAKLWNLGHDGNDFVVGAYPMKKFDMPIGAWVGGKLVTLDSLEGPTEVDFAGTGFMLIHKNVFLKMNEAYPDLVHDEGLVGESYALFNPFIRNRTNLSEDYALCQRWKDIGGKIMLDPSIRLKHWGIFVYGGPGDPRVS